MATRAVRRRLRTDSGQNIPESQRGTRKVQLRVLPEVAELIRERGEREGGASAYVSRLVLEDDERSKDV